MVKITKTASHGERNMCDIKHDGNNPNRVKAALSEEADAGKNSARWQCDLRTRFQEDRSKSKKCKLRHAPLKNPREADAN